MYAVEVINGFKYFGDSSNKFVVLDSIDVKIKTGMLYSLLGPSGCGKTTLLSCVIGLMTLNDGDIKVYGKSLKMRKSVIPHLGYMPQDLSLIVNFSIREIVFYFGKLYGMNSNEIEEKLKYFISYFVLPHENQLLENCSGGEQRCVSFIVSVMHNPKILILDEPTVGLDPILRENMWEFLISTVGSTKMTVILTTHYIEEARKSDCVGIMRHGKLLAEDSPQSIMINLNVTTLEEAFLRLCMKGYVDKAIDCENSNDILEEIYDDGEEDHKTAVCSLSRIYTITEKNYRTFIRLPGVVYFILLCPIVMMLLTYWSLGVNIKGLKFGLVNEEVSDINECSNKSLITAIPEDFSCNLNKLSCRFLNYLDDYILTEQYETVEEALKHKQDFIIHFSSNFSESLRDVLDNMNYADEGSISNRNIEIHFTSIIFPILIKEKLLNIFKSFTNNLMLDCELPGKLGTVPINFENDNTDIANKYRYYFGPGVFLGLFYSMSIMLTSGGIIHDRLEGTWYRNMLAGVKSIEVVAGHLIANGLVLILVFTTLTIAGLSLYDVPVTGKFHLLLLLLTLLGLSGLSCGLFISTVCSSFKTALFGTSGILMAFSLLNSMMWPLEGQPTILRYISSSLPTTLVISAFRILLYKDSNHMHPTVLSAYGISIFWIFIFLLISILKLSKH